MPVVDLLHLFVIVAALGIGVWSLIAFRTTMPRGRFAISGLASIGALFGCAALSGEVGVLPPAAWFVVVITGMLAVAALAQRFAGSGLRES